MKRNDTRSLTVNSQAWEYKIGKNTVAIYDTEGKRYFPKFVDIVGEKSFQDKEFYLNPAQILDYILVNILGGVSVKADKKCKYCLKAKPSVRLRVNPFEGEINQNYTKHYICDSCIDNLSDEI